MVYCLSYVDYKSQLNANVPKWPAAGVCTAALSEVIHLLCVI